MAFNIIDAIKNIFHSDEKETSEEQRKRAYLQSKANTVFGTNEKTKTNTINPFLKSDGSLVNPLLNYQKILDNPSVSTKAKDYIQSATGLSPTYSSVKPSNNKNTTTNSGSYKRTSGNTGAEVKFNANADPNSLGNMDIINDLPKLTPKQIETIISKHYGNSEVIKPSDAQAIYNAQVNSGVSALVTLGIGALESGWGTSNIAKKTRNLWGYGATNDNPEGNAHKYTTMEDAALRYSNSLKKDYYNGYGAKTINSIGTGNNPAGKGYAYNNDGSISTTWSPTVTSIMKTLYNTAKSAS